MTFHKDLTLYDIHVPHAWSYADAAARLAATGFVAADVGKLARQEDTSDYYSLTSTAPTWKGFSSGTAQQLSKDFTLESPTTAANFRMFRTPGVAITVTRMVVTVTGTSTPAVTVDIRHNTDRSSAGTALINAPVSSNQASNSAETTGHVITSFDTPNIAANEHVWLEIDAVSGDVETVEITIEYTQI